MSHDNLANLMNFDRKTNAHQGADYDTRIDLDSTKPKKGVLEKLKEVTGTFYKKKNHAEKKREEMGRFSAEGQDDYDIEKYLELMETQRLEELYKEVA